MRALIFMLANLIAVNTSNADTISNTYTKIDFEKSCIWEKAASEEEANMGGRAVCEGLKISGEEYPVYFAEGDIRQFVGFGYVSEPEKIVGGFSEWNSINTTIEWRIRNDKPFATILRWFIDNIDPETSSADAKRRGNVLVISTVAESSTNGGSGLSCAIGYVDARANKNANQLAQEIADNYASDFTCGSDQPRFYGKRGEYSGTPNDLVESQRRN